MVTISNPSLSMKVRLISFHVLQLRGEAGQMQVKDPEIGLIHNIGILDVSFREDESRIRKEKHRRTLQYSGTSP